MSVSMHRLSVPVITRALGSLARLLEKAESHALANDIEPASLVGARLAADMLTLAGQVQRASDTSKGAIARLAGLPAPSMVDNEVTFADLQSRIARTIAFVESAGAERLDHSADRVIDLNLRGIPGPMRGDDYLLQFVLPNLYFHVSTAYAILRHFGVALGKMDYLGRFDAGE